jgi:hypothetical protein
MKYSVILSMALLIFLPFLLSIRNLNSIDSANILEKGVSLIGIIFLTPVFYPEANDNILETVMSKKVSVALIYIIRILASLFFILLLTALFALLMKHNNCKFEYFSYLFGTFSSAFFMGSIGIAFSAFTCNTATGYFASLIYYIFNYFAGKKLGLFYMFSMSENSFTEKYILLVSAIIFVCAAIYFDNLKLFKSVTLIMRRHS